MVFISGLLWRAMFVQKSLHVRNGQLEAFKKANTPVRPPSRRTQSLSRDPVPHDPQRGLLLCPRHCLPALSGLELHGSGVSLLLVCGFFHLSDRREACRVITGRSSLAFPRLCSRVGRYLCVVSGRRCVWLRASVGGWVAGPCLCSGGGGAV